MITALALAGSVLIGIVAAWAAGQLLRGNGFGLLGNMLAGVLGAVVGGHFLRIAGFNIGGGLAGRLIAASAGAAIVLFLVHLYTGRRQGHRLWS
jgi:uncharacterized membrane protein YeaQ/YmgE (transglycosylase-associated protein family)